MTSKYFKKSDNILNKVKPVIDVDNLHNKISDYWYLQNHLFESWCWQDDVFCEDELNSIIKLGNLFIEEDAYVGMNDGFLNKQIRECKLSWFKINQYTSWIYQKVTETVNANNEKFFKFDLDKIETLQFAKYKEEDNGFYEKHTDPFVGVRDPHNRKLSFVLQLSSPQDYEGGDLIFHFGKDPAVMEKRRGRVILFPSYTLHEVTPVTKGTRYSLVGWVHGPAFK